MRVLSLDVNVKIQEYGIAWIMLQARWSALRIKPFQKVGGLAFIEDSQSQGYHSSSVGNPSYTTPAITLHLCPSPPFKKCTIRLDERHKPTTSSISVDTIYGRKV
jgi:hypothetical protein